MKTPVINLRVLAMVIAFFIPFLSFSRQGSWFWQNPLPTGNNLRAVYFKESSIGLTVGEAGTIFRTTNSGSNWTSQISGTKNFLNSV